MPPDLRKLDGDTLTLATYGTNVGDRIIIALSFPKQPQAATSDSSPSRK